MISVAIRTQNAQCADRNEEGGKVILSECQLVFCLCNFTALLSQSSVDITYT